jgi:hypothetical protein
MELRTSLTPARCWVGSFHRFWAPPSQQHKMQLSPRSAGYHCAMKTFREVSGERHTAVPTGEGAWGTPEAVWTSQKRNAMPRRESSRSCPARRYTDRTRTRTRAQMKNERSHDFPPPYAFVPQCLASDHIQHAGLSVRTAVMAQSV